MVLWAMVHLPFCYIAEFADIGKGITNFRTAGKVMLYHISPNGSAGGCFSACAVSWRHKAFNLHTFRPYYFSQFLEKSGCFTSGQRADISGSWYIFSSSAGKGQHGRSRRVTKARELRRASGRKQLTDKFVCVPETDGRILPA